MDHVTYWIWSLRLRFLDCMRLADRDTQWTFYELNKMCMLLLDLYTESTFGDNVWFLRHSPEKCSSLNFTQRDLWWQRLYACHTISTNDIAVDITYICRSKNDKADRGNKSCWLSVIQTWPVLEVEWTHTFRKSCVYETNQDRFLDS